MFADSQFFPSDDKAELTTCLSAVCQFIILLVPSCRKHTSNVVPANLLSSTKFCTYSENCVILHFYFFS